MMSNNLKELIALKKFSLISPVVNGQVNNHAQYFREVCSKPIDMPHYGLKRYSPKTLANWLSEYRRGGFDALKPGNRSDQGKSRKITKAIAEKIQHKLEEYPRIRASVLYDKLLDEGVISPYTVSKATFYRYLANNPTVKQMLGEGQIHKERKRFAYQNVNELWQTDVLYGPHLQVGRQKKRTYLICFIDDASRLVPYGKFCFEQNFLTMRAVLKEAIARRGIPKLLYTDNAKIYRSQQLSVICARMGCNVLHAQPFDPQGKGKIERLFRTVRIRFLDGLKLDKTMTIDALNQAFWKWLEEDYHHKTHSGINMSPLDYFMSQANNLRMIPDPIHLDEYFLLKTGRKVLHDATLTIENTTYETALELANQKVEVRYEPGWIGQAHYTLPLFINDQKVGEAKLTNKAANARAKRRRAGRPPKDKPEVNEAVFLPQPDPPSLSFARLYGLTPDKGDGN